MIKGKNRVPWQTVALVIVTLGFYGFYWMYQVTKELKYYTGNPNYNPVLELILCIIFFPYIIYWFYKYGKVVAEVQGKAKIAERDNAVLYAVLAALGLFFVNIPMMQSDLNLVWAV